MQRSFAEVFELVLLSAFALGFVLIAQRVSQTLFQIGLGIVVISTFLEIAVGNIPVGASVRRSLVMIMVYLCIIAAVFGIGIALVPYLTDLGR